MRRTCLNFLAVTGTLLVTLPAVAQGPVSAYYLTAGDQNTMHRLIGTSVTSWADGASNEYPIAVYAGSGTIRTAGRNSSEFGREYTLTGTPTGGGPYSYASLVGDAYDSTTDGTFNYLAGFGNQAVYRTNLDYSGATLLFGGLGQNFLGITYDPSNNSLWLSAWNSQEIRNYTLGGTLLSSFNAATASNGALALDPATDTLWVNTQSELGRYREYDKAGNLLQSVLIPALQTQNVLGGEFAFAPAAVPEPATLAFLGMGAVGGVTWLRKRKRRRVVSAND
jgi:hypothetical protein